jgi:hypothetical protein
MNKHYDPPLAVDSFNPAPARPRVRYVGFEGIDGGRRLTFSVKSLGHESVDITFEISDLSFKSTSAISIQDAAPMAYEKLVELLASKSTFDSEKLCLSEADIERYITRHFSSQKRSYSISDKRRRSNVGF